MKVSSSRKVKEYRMQTLAGQPVYNYGKSFTLIADSHRLMTTCFESDLRSPWSAIRLEKANAALGQPVEWTFNRAIEVMYVYARF